MSRLDEEFVLGLVHNRSGIGAGELDYSIYLERFDKLDANDLDECKKLLQILITKCTDKLHEIL